ncbi:uncharacterized protein LOC129600583 [Paramacrobiotus metropolitanus]|uniref:uncharacterized protein LOC129600583 n=1 Tax=Paramacrobiotus metropolitanus TaxID=2943436 RepID=UPI0024460F43|nr:uncharacterized protein LOC129600583 [Paramacrobiotus metropolitanus]XP_055355120.1 uncharacterized protein LOC129600583 [Paramacrobiotus metropolitanus]
MNKTISMVLIGLVSLLPSIVPQQYAESYAPGETQRYRLSTLDILPDDDSANAIVIERVRDKEVTKSPDVLQRRRFHHKEQVLTETAQPLVHPDEPDFIVKPEMFKRQKRDLLPWQLAYRSRYQDFLKKSQEADPATSTPSTTKKPPRLLKQSNRRKFIRQFVGDEMASSMMDENSVTNTKPAVDDQSTEDRPFGLDDPSTAATTTTTTTTTTSTTTSKQTTAELTTTEVTTPETETTKKKKRKHKKKTTTTTVATTEEDDTTEAPTTVDPRIAKEAARMKEAADVVNDIIGGINDKKDADRFPNQDNLPTWARKELDMELDPRKNPLLKDLMVDKHNVLRSMVMPAAANMLKMEWNEEAARIAQRWANECKFEHDKGEVRVTQQFKCGQNLARSWPKPMSWNLTMQLWFDERKDFIFDGHPRGMVGHYTQLVWAQSYQLGCGYKDCGTFHHYVCDYCPAGNVDTRKYKPYKDTPKACAACPNDCDESGTLCTNTCPYYNQYGNCDDLEKEFSICTDKSYGLEDKCKATCKCKGKIY